VDGEIESNHLMVWPPNLGQHKDTAMQVGVLDRMAGYRPNPRGLPSVNHRCNSCQRMASRHVACGVQVTLAPEEAGSMGKRHLTILHCCATFPYRSPETAKGLESTRATGPQSIRLAPCCANDVDVHPVTHARQPNREHLGGCVNDVTRPMIDVPRPRVSKSTFPPLRAHLFGFKRRLVATLANLSDPDLLDCTPLLSDIATPSLFLACN